MYIKIHKTLNQTKKFIPFNNKQLLILFASLFLNPNLQVDFLMPIVLVNEAFLHEELL